VRELKELIPGLRLYGTTLKRGSCRIELEPIVYGVGPYSGRSGLWMARIGRVRAWQNASKASVVKEFTKQQESNNHDCRD